jgi:bifunctional UDP-N-acetylglucosamine pyrophosphorylase / glucosamine-1-phosphate N-acetyltransferase
MSERRLEIAILAAGQGKRMKSKRIKVLHHAAGKALIDYVLDLSASLSATVPVVVIGHDRDAVRDHCGERARFAVQEQQLGTGHALLQAATMLGEELQGSDVLVLSGDVPLTRAGTIHSMLAEHQSRGHAVTMMTMVLDDAGSYGRIVRGQDGNVERIVEARDATAQELQIREANAGIYVFRGERLLADLESLSAENAQGEYYLTDVVTLAHARGETIGALVADEIEALGVNSRRDLALVDRELVRRTVANLMAEGVTFRDPDSVTVDSTVSIGSDSIVYPYVVLEGATSIGSDCVIGPGVHLKNCRVADGVKVNTGTVGEDSVVETGASVGPYAHLRAGTVLGEKVKVGNFVETKKAVFGRGAKASHLSYVGDAEIGADVNIGAGTITCNYDGVSKYRTVLEDGVFIGSDTQLVAPVRVGKGAYVGAGSTITKDVPPDALALTRTPQRNVEGWAKKKRDRQRKG